MKSLLLISCLFVLSNSKKTTARRLRTGPTTMRRPTTTPNPTTPKPNPSPTTTTPSESPCKTILNMMFNWPLEIPCHECYSCKLDTIVICDSVTKIYTGMNTLNLNPLDRDNTIEQMCSYLGDSLDNIYAPGTNGMVDCFEKCYYNPEMISKLKMVITAFKSANTTQLFLERIGNFGEVWMTPYEKYIDNYAPEICDHICYSANYPIFPPNLEYPEYYIE